MNQWWRSWHGAPTDPKWLAIAQRTQTNAGTVSAVAWALFDHASQQEDRGDISTFDAESYGAYSGFGGELIEAIIQALTDKKLIQNNRLTAWEKRQPRREDGSAERAKEWRERKRTQANAKEHRLEEIREDKNKKEGEVDSSLRSPKPANVSRGTRLPEGWTPDEEGRAYALTVLSPDQIQPEIENFTDYWRAANGAKAVKRDWSAVWRMWVRNSVKFSGGGNGPGRSRSFQDDSKSVSRAIERQRGLTIAPRPRLVPDTGEGDLRLLPPGRSAGP